LNVTGNAATKAPIASHQCSTPSPASVPRHSAADSPSEIILQPSTADSSPSAPATRPASAPVLRHFLQLPVQIQQFHERWLNLPEHSQSSLSSPHRPAGRNLKLGLETVVGTRARDCQSCFRVVLGPLTRSRFESLLPGQLLPQQIIDLIRLYAGPELDFEVQLLLVRSDVPSLKFSPDTGSNRRLGWTTWLGTGTLPSAADDVVFRFSGLPTPA
jgi:predicted component of type VI protein secretion system